jgi:hypothetical protein
VTEASFQILHADDADERRRWEELHAGWSEREVFAHPAYVSLFAGPNERAMAAYSSSPAGWILYPFILREIEPGLTDITTAYGYGGPFRTGAPDPEPFWEQFAAWAASQGIVSEFVRFSLFEDQLIPFPGEREEKLVNIVRTLDPDEDLIWESYEHKVRKNVNKARRSGVSIEVDLTGAHLDEFYRIYEGTMDRREARRGYYFPRSFFETIASGLAGQFAYFHALVEGRIVSTELALVSAENVYSFLGGTDQAAFDMRPNDLLKHELIVWAKRAGKRRFVLGGGYTAEDGIVRYKKAFAPTGQMPFYIGRRVFDQPSYDRLTAQRGAAPAPGFFPAYRAPLPE